MTAICGGGTSGAKTNVAAIVDYTSGLLAAIFAAYDLTWLIPVIPVVGLAPLALNTFCASDPPAMPTLTAAEANALLQQDITSTDYATGLPKFRDICLRLIWPDACQCTSGALIPPVAPTPPNGTAITQYQKPLAGPCLTISPSSTNYIGTNSGDSIWRVDWTNPSNAVIRSDQIAVVSGLQSIVSDITVPIGAAGFIVILTEPVVHSGGFNVGGVGIASLAQPSLVEFTVSKTYNAATNTVTETWSANVFCGNNTPQSQISQCCPVDPASQATMDAILSLVTLVQRQTAPFAYVLGDLIGGLTGSGEVTVHGCIGAKFDFPFGVPSHIGLDVGDPTTYFMSSWVNWGNADGFTQREFLSATPYLSFPPLPGQFTKIGYSLAPAIQMNIYPLLREP